MKTWSPMTMSRRAMSSESPMQRRCESAALIATNDAMSQSAPIVTRAPFALTSENPPIYVCAPISGSPLIGAHTYIGGFSEVNAKGARVTIGADCDIASFVAINAADSHRRCIGLSEDIARRDIVIGDHVFIGSHSAVLGGAVIGHHSVIAAG